MSLRQSTRGRRPGSLLTRRAWGLGLAGAVVAPALVQAGLVSQGRAAALGAPIGSVPVGAAIDHPQGLEVSADGRTWWITSVVRARRAGLLVECDASTGALQRRIDVHVGDCYHPGGFSRAGERLWVPVAEYRRASRSLVQCREVATLAVVSTFEVADHIGCLAADGTRLVGANWDARTFYEWSPDGREVVRRENPQAAGYQDMKWVDGRLIAGGLLGNTGVIDVLEWPSLTLLSRLDVGRTDRGVLYTHEGLAVTGDRVLVVPEDDPASVFAFPRPRAI